MVIRFFRSNNPTGRCFTTLQQDVILSHCVSGALVMVSRKKKDAGSFQNFLRLGRILPLRENPVRCASSIDAIRLACPKLHLILPAARVL
jgi:hypothetical protein